MLRMLRTLRVVAFEAFLLLRRDKVFLPAVLAGLAVTIFANLASDWSIENFEKILFDVGYFGFNVTGGLVAVFWGTKAVTDSRQDGALEVQLAAPVGRTTWLVGKFFGMCLALILLGLVLTAVWQVLMLLNDFGRMNPAELEIFAFMVLSWIVLAALATLFASFCRQPIAMFCTLSLWVAGLASSLIDRALVAGTARFSKPLVSFIARVWDFQQFNLLSVRESANSWLTRSELMWRGFYGLVLVMLLISIACIIFERRDATA